ncbi:MAG: hypothetical protein K0R28_3506 [Paenibacillus sp.]|nr:hypothetical protein [Paenibacillus sp.]
MRVYMVFIWKAFLQRFTYRANSYFFILSSILRLSILASLWSALLGEGSVQGTTVADMMAFVMINMIVSALTRSNIANKLAERFNDGSIAIDFIRPIRLKYYLISEQLGENLYSTIFHILPVAVVGLVFLDIQLPDAWWQSGMFVLTLVLGIVLVYMINYLIGLLVFWMKTAFYTNWLLGALMELFAGSVVPLWFYPAGLYHVAMALPFRFISFEPISIFLGRTTWNESWTVVGFQLVWIAVLLLVERVLWRSVQTKVIIQGG